jgi:hypothetical protein
VKTKKSNLNIANGTYNTRKFLKKSGQNMKNDRYCSRNMVINTGKKTNSLISHIMQLLT